MLSSQAWDECGFQRHFFLEGGAGVDCLPPPASRIIFPRHIYFWPCSRKGRRNLQLNHLLLETFDLALLFAPRAIWPNGARWRPLRWRAHDHAHGPCLAEGRTAGAPACPPLLHPNPPAKEKRKLAHAFCGIRNSRAPSWRLVAPLSASPSSTSARHTRTE